MNANQKYTKKSTTNKKGWQYGPLCMCWIFIQVRLKYSVLHFFQIAMAIRYPIIFSFLLLRLMKLRLCYSLKIQLFPFVKIQLFLFVQEKLNECNLFECYWITEIFLQCWVARNSLQEHTDRTTISDHGSQRKTYQKYIAKTFNFGMNTGLSNFPYHFCTNAICWASQLC